MFGCVTVGKAYLAQPDLRKTRMPPVIKIKHTTAQLLQALA